MVTGAPSNAGTRALRYRADTHEPTAVTGKGPPSTIAELTAPLGENVTAT